MFWIMASVKNLFDKKPMICQWIVCGKSSNITFSVLIIQSQPSLGVYPLPMYTRVHYNGTQLNIKRITQ